MPNDDTIAMRTGAPVGETPGPETFTDAQQERLTPHFTNNDGSVFALTNLAETVKGALFARYSRSAKSLRRLFLDEFLDNDATGANSSSEAGVERAQRLYGKVLGEYGDDSVAQLGSAHIACEGVSNVLTKILERGRLMSYLEQSTRYVPYTARPGGRWKYVTPEEIRNPQDIKLYEAVLDKGFEIYTRWLQPVEEHFSRRYPRVATDSAALHQRAIRAKALDALRGLLPAATRSNLGIHGSGQSFETLLVRLGAHPLAEARTTGDAMLTELRKVIPAFLGRVDRPERGGVWQRYLRARERAANDYAKQIGPGTLDVRPRDEQAATVALLDFDPEGETKVLAGLLYAQAGSANLASIRRQLANDTREERSKMLRAIVGDRTNRRHRPGRGFEQTEYTFEVTSDYGAFRDLQRHRMLSMDWQLLTTTHGPATPHPAVVEVGNVLADWTRVMDTAETLHERLNRQYGPFVAQYAVPMAYRIRFTMRMNAREAMHVIELRTQPAGHPSYRRVCQEMHHLIRDRAGHAAIAEAIRFANHEDVGLERLASERRHEAKRKEQ